MTQEMPFRKATLDDKEYILTLLKEFYSKSPHKAMEFSTSVVSTNLSWYIDEQLVLIGDGCLLIACEVPSTFSTAKIACEIVVYVQEHLRGQGIGRKLIEALEEWGKERNCSFAQIGAVEDELLPFMTALMLRKNYMPMEHIYIKELK